MKKSFYQWATETYGKGSSPASQICSIMKNSPNFPKTSGDIGVIKKYLQVMKVTESQMRTLNEMFRLYAKVV